MDRKTSFEFLVSSFEEVQKIALHCPIET